MFLKKIKSLFHKKLIRPIIESDGSIYEVSLGVAIGIFFALTPTVGIQMYSVVLIWAICRYIFKINFKLSVALAMVWISNPITMIPLYYIFLVSGYLVLGTREKLNFEIFNDHIANLSQINDTLTSVIEILKFLIIDLGWPMVVGSIFYAIPGSIIGFLVCKKVLYSYREGG